MMCFNPLIAVVVVAGMDGFFVQFFSGLITILALLGHRFHGGRVR